MDKEFAEAVKQAEIEVDLNIVLKATAIKRKIGDSANERKNLDEALKLVVQKKKKNFEEVKVYNTVEPGASHQ